MPNAAADKPNILDAMLNLQPQVRHLSDLATICAEWAADQTSPERGRQIDRLIYAVVTLAQMANDLSEGYHRTLDDSFTSHASPPTS
jgi:hypothetical protein